jgi:hypothetical protein
MSITVASGYTHLSGGLVTPARLNTAITGLTISAAASKLLGTTVAGAISEIDYTAAGLAMLQAADLAAQKTLLGIGPGSAVESDVTAALGISKSSSIAGGSSGSVVFDSANAPSVALTAGTWVLTGAVTMTMGTANYMRGAFYNLTDSAEFGGSPGVSMSTAPIPVSGKITVASGTKTIVFKGYFKNISGGALNGVMGQTESTMPAGYIVAQKLSS